MIKTLIIGLLVFCGQAFSQARWDINTGGPYKKAVEIFDFENEILFYEEFIIGNTADNTIGSGFRGVVSGTGANFEQWAIPSAGAYGTIQVTNGTATGAYATIFSQLNCLGTPSSGTLFFSVKVRNANSVTGVLHRFGFSDVQVNSAPVDAVLLEVDSDSTVARGGNYLTVLTSNNSSATYTKTAFQFDADTDWHWYTIGLSSGMVQVWVDNTLYATVTTNVPSVSDSRLFGVVVGSLNRDTAEEKLWLDKLVVMKMK